MHQRFKGCYYLLPALQQYLRVWWGTSVLPSAQTQSRRKVPDLIPTMICSTSRSESIQVGPRATSQSGLGRPFVEDWGRRGPSLFRQRRSSRLPKQAQMANFPGKGGSDGKERNLLKAIFSNRFAMPKANLPLEQPGP